MKTYILLFLFFFTTIFRAAALDDEGCVILESECFNIKYKGAIVNGDRATMNFTVTAKCDVPFKFVQFHIPTDINLDNAQNGNSSYTFDKTIGTNTGSPSYKYLRFTATGATPDLLQEGQSEVFTYSVPRNQYELMDFMYITVSGGSYTFTVCINPKGCSITEQIPDPVCEFTTENGGATFGFIDAMQINGTPRTRVRFKVKNNNSTPISQVKLEARTAAGHLSVAPQNSLGQYAYIYLWEPDVQGNKYITYDKVNSDGSTGNEEDVLTFIIATASLNADPSFQFTMTTLGGDESTIKIENIRTCEVLYCPEGIAVSTPENDMTVTYQGTSLADGMKTVRFDVTSNEPIESLFIQLNPNTSDIVTVLPTISTAGYAAVYNEENYEVAYSRTGTGSNMISVSFEMPAGDFLEIYGITVLKAGEDVATGGTFTTFQGKLFEELFCEFEPLEPLPVELSAFEGKSTAGGIELNWTTATEQGSDRFDVQRSTNGKEYTTIGTVKAAGNSHSKLSYSFTDKAPAKGTNYYRLKLVDLNGSTEFSKTVALESAGSVAVASSVTVYPNPVTGDNVSIALNDNSIGNKTLAVSITDMNGRTVFEKLLTTTDSEVRLTLSELKIAKGLYLVKVLGDNKVETQKLLIK